MYTSPPEKSGILHFLHWQQMSGSESSEDDDHSGGPVFEDTESKPEPMSEEELKAESAKLAALQEEIKAHQAELVASQTAEKQIAKAKTDVVSSTEL